MKKRKIAEGKTDMWDPERLGKVMALRAEGLLFREIGAQLGIGAKYASYLHQIATIRAHRLSNGVAE